MSELDYAALAASPVATDPFPHVVVANFVPPDRLRAVVVDLPPLGRRGSFPLDALTLGPNARALMDELEGPRLRQAIAGRFGLDLADAPTMVTPCAAGPTSATAPSTAIDRKARDGAAVSQPGE
jgi:hypothetical protein